MNVPTELVAEQKVLGALLARWPGDPEVDEALALLEPGHFADPAHRMILAAWRRIAALNKPAVALAALEAELETQPDAEEFRQIGGFDYLVHLKYLRASGANDADLRRLSRAIRKAWRRRSMMGLEPIEGAV